MSSTPQPVRGTQSLLGEEADRLHEVVAAFDRVRRLYGFKRVEVPVFEKTEVFARTMGETTDVVSKEMYSFLDNSGDSITLRPEFTAGIARAFLSEGWQQHVPLRVAAHGPAFRYERPQKGRFRQFHQLDAEIIGSDDPEDDVEVIALGWALLAKLRIKNVTLKLNTLGDADSRQLWRNQLVEYFSSFRADLSPESQDRLERNPLRILDSKDPRDRTYVENAPAMRLSNGSQEFFGKVQDGLKRWGIPTSIDPHLVRGLDYYRHTVFEFVTDQLGAQGTVLAGGRYDGLIEHLGGPHTPAVGWAAGIERLAMLLPTELKPTRTAALVIESDQPKLLNLGTLILKQLRRYGMPTQLVADGSVRKRFSRALKLEPDYVVILLESHRSNSVATFRVKRRIFDRYNTTGKIYGALKGLMANQFGIEPDQLKRVAQSGGDLELRPKNQQ